MIEARKDLNLSGERETLLVISEVTVHHFHSNKAAGTRISRRIDLPKVIFANRLNLRVIGKADSELFQSLPRCTVFRDGTLRRGADKV
jgi:hypothetical protein